MFGSVSVWCVLCVIGCCVLSLLLNWCCLLFSCGCLLCWCLLLRVNVAWYCVLCVVRWLVFVVVCCCLLLVGGVWCVVVCCVVCCSGCG